MNDERARERLGPASWSRRIERLENFAAEELSMALDESGIDRVACRGSLPLLIGRANNEAGFALDPGLAPATASPRGRTRDSQGRFTSSRADALHPPAW
jgi:hypothetical protein